MGNQELRNYLRPHRKKSGLSLRELAIIVGYAHKGQVSRHERSEAVPPLTIAFGYAVVYRVSVSALFPGIYEEVREAVEARLRELEQNLQDRRAKRGELELIAQRLVWMMERRDGSGENEDGN